MELLKAVLGRRSIRKFTDKEVDREDIVEIIKAGTWAPTAGNMQSWRFFVVSDPSVKEELWRACRNQNHVKDASHVIVVCYDRNPAYRTYGRRGEERYAIQETAAATQNLMLRAHELGLGTCWVGAFDDRAVAEVLELEDNIKPVVVVPVGYPNESPKGKRKDIKELAKFVEKKEE